MSRQTEPHPGALVATGARTLALAERQTQIANRALGQIERERFIESYDRSTGCGNTARPGLCRGSE
jgi:hypothetical protein